MIQTVDVPQDLQLMTYLFFTILIVLTVNLLKATYKLKIRRLSNEQGVYGELKKVEDKEARMVDLTNQIRKIKAQSEAVRKESSAFVGQASNGATLIGQSSLQFDAKIRRMASQVHQPKRVSYIDQKALISKNIKEKFLSQEQMS